MVRIVLVALAACIAFANTLHAQDCGGTYRVKRGESLSVIADRLYKDARKWTAIHAANLDKIGQDPDTVFVGLPLQLTCINGLPSGLAGTSQEPKPTPAATPVTPTTGPRRIDVVTAGDFAPFTDQSLQNGGLLAEIVETALRSTIGPDGYKVHWINDWSAHLDPLMTNTMMDMAFPWYQPDCAGDPSQFRCENFFFSEPMFEMLILLFVHEARPIPFASDADMEGRVLCRPAGYFTHDLDRADRRWLRDGKITLVQPETVKDCFELLRDGRVDAVAINEFTGRTAIRDLGLEAEIDAVQRRPLSIEGLHVLVHKDHPQASGLIANINFGLSRIKGDGSYQKIIDRHMSTIWAGL